MSLAPVPIVERPPPHPIELRPGIGWPPAIPNVAFASPTPAQSNAWVTIVIWLKPNNASLTSDELKIRFQLNATLRKGDVVFPPSSSAKGRLSLVDSYSEIERRPNTLSFPVAFQSMRTSP